MDDAGFERMTVGSFYDWAGLDELGETADDWGLMANENTVNGTEANFASEVEQADVPVLVDFWAEWCGPCRMISPMLDQLAAETAGAAKVVKVNVDENRALAAKYNVQSIPMLLFFKDGQVRDTVVGAGTQKDALKSKLMALA